MVSDTILSLLGEQNPQEETSLLPSQVVERAPSGLPYHFQDPQIRSLLYLDVETSSMTQQPILEQRSTVNSLNSKRLCLPT